MSKTIFSKLVIIFISILFFSSIITGIMLFIFLGTFVTEEKTKLLDNSGEKINEFLSMYIENQENPLFKKISKDLLNFYGDNTNSIIWIINKDGYIVLYNERNTPSIITKKIQTNSGKLKLPDVRQYKDVLSGNTKVVKEIGNYYELFNGTKIIWITVEK